MRFNVSPDLVAQLAQMSKQEMSADPVALIEGLYKFVQKTVGTDVLDKAKYTFSKQIENFEDVLTLATKNIFEQGRIYAPLTQAALAFQTSFAAMSQNPVILSAIQGLLVPVVNKLENAVSKFTGLSPGMLRTMSMPDIENYIESVFSNMTPEEYQQRLKAFVNDLINTFSTFKKQSEVVFEPIRQFAYSMFSDIGKAGAEILGQAAISVLKGFVSNPLGLLSFGATFATAMVPISLGFKLASSLFDKIVSIKLTKDSIEDAIARRQYELGYKKDPLLELQSKIARATAAFDANILQRNIKPLSEFIPNIITGPLQSVQQPQRLTPLISGAQAPYGAFKPEFLNFEKGIYEALYKPIEKFGGQISQLLSDDKIQDRLSRSPKLG